MDNGEQQREMARKIKAEVKQSARRRRGISLMHNIVQSITTTTPGHAFQLSHLPSYTAQYSHRLRTDTPTLDHSTTLNPLLSHETSQGTPGPVPLDAPPCQSGASEANGHYPRPESIWNETGIGSIIGYMDYVFPALFPFYRPAIIEGGRSWLPMLAAKNSGFGNSIISLSSYFFSVVPVVPGPGHAKCSADIWEELREQTGLALAGVQRDLVALRARGVDTSLQDSVHLLATIVLLLDLERELFQPSKWQMHLKAAIALLEQILRYHGRTNNSQEPSIKSVLKKLDGPVPIASPTAEKGAFRFFSAVLVVNDIIASTFLGHPPTLLPLLIDVHTCQSNNKFSLGLDNITGCQDWVFLLLSEVSTLDVWKKRNDMTAKVTRDELWHRATAIETRWRDGIERLYQQQIHQCHSNIDFEPASRPLESILNKSNGAYGLHPWPSDMYFPVTGVWAHATHTYLLVVLLDWQPMNQEIRSSIRRTMSHLSEITSPTWLRTLVWPICVTGCLAGKEERPIFRSILENTAALGVLRSVRETLDIMEHVWSQRDLGNDAWDIAKCLGSLGSRALLV